MVGLCTWVAFGTSCVSVYVSDAKYWEPIGKWPRAESVGDVTDDVT